VGVDRPVDPIEAGLSLSVERDRPHHRHQPQERERRPRLAAWAEQPLDGEQQQRHHQVELLLGRERPAAAHPALPVVGEEGQVRADPLPLPQREREERHPGEVERPDPQSAPEQEAWHVQGARPLELPLQLAADEEAGEDEEQVDPRPAVTEEGEAPDARGDQLRPGDGEVVADHQDDGRRAQGIERGEGSGRRDEQRPERTPRPALLRRIATADALAHARRGRWVAERDGANPRGRAGADRRLPDGAMSPGEPSRLRRGRRGGPRRARRR